MPSKQVLETKKGIVDELAQEFSQAQSIVLAEYRGLTVAQDTEMRAALRKEEVTYKVIKNTLSSRALAQAGLNGLDDLLTGPTAIAFSKKDMITPAKVLKEFSAKYNKLKLKGGYLEGKVLDLDELNSLASIPGRDVLYGQLVFGLMSPITSLAFILNAIREKMEAGDGNAAPAEAAEA
ncbi:MAG: 50S ribosomal protein L10 [Clostridiaceae bacterium]|mgnify:FL=1|jgi:large subunit ribosomal protein L10|nr:50S ribosomal protein L10 [Clostridiales bacterium]MDD4139249.1 50S ribosomal protein L10 [Eubacteriales bacterium]MDD4744814.1 50S ribosomal protein L10 [Eubacteriales bacterium]NLB44913.1 50S ribosomal protein L10 [Clostridiaceae bacterium]